MAPLVSGLHANKHIEAVAVKQLPTFEAAKMFLQSEGVLPAPETAHALRVVIDEALVDFESLQLSRQLGYSGVALKACKGHSEALLMGAAAQAGADVAIVTPPAPVSAAAMALSVLNQDYIGDINLGCLSLKLR